MLPDTKTSPSTAELHRILQSAAYSMLEGFLSRYRANRRSGPSQLPLNPNLEAVSTPLRLDKRLGFEFMKYC